MRLMILVISALFLWVSGAIPPARAETRLSPLHDPAVDFALRLKLIDDARETIHIAMFHQGIDELGGRPFIEALRSAARRGVRVRVVTSYLASWHSHALKDLPLLLNDDSLETRPELITFGRFFSTPIDHARASFWNTFDEKFLVVDGREAVFGGRGQGGEYLEWKDSAVYLRGDAVDGLERLFEDCWSDAVRYFGSTRKDPKPRGARKLRAERPARPDIYSKKLTEALALRENPRFTPASIDVLHHDLIHKLSTLPGDPLEPMPDPILERFLALSESARHIRFYSHMPRMDVRMTAALKRATERGATVELLTNSLESLQVLDANGLPYLASLPSQKRMLRDGVRIHQWIKQFDSDFLHQKLAILDDVVLLGSHNLNWSSSHSTDQADLAIRDLGLAAEYAAIFDDEWARHSRPVEVDFLMRQQDQNSFRMVLAGWLSGLF